MDVHALRGRMRSRSLARAAPYGVRLASGLPRPLGTRPSRRPDLVQRVWRAALARLPGAQGMDVDQGARRLEVRTSRGAELRAGAVPLRARDRKSGAGADGARTAQHRVLSL